MFNLDLMWVLFKYERSKVNWLTMAHNHNTNQKHTISYPILLFIWMVALNIKHLKTTKLSELSSTVCKNKVLIRAPLHVVTTLYVVTTRLLTQFWVECNVAVLRRGDWEIYACHICFTYIEPVISGWWRKPMCQETTTELRNWIGKLLNLLECDSDLGIKKRHGPLSLDHSAIEAFLNTSEQSICRL